MINSDLKMNIDRLIISGETILQNACIMAPKGTSVGNSQAKGPKLDETLESHYDNVIINDTEEAIPH